MSREERERKGKEGEEKQSSATEDEDERSPLLELSGDHHTGHVEGSLVELNITPPFPSQTYDREVEKEMERTQRD